MNKKITANNDNRSEENFLLKEKDPSTSGKLAIKLNDVGLCYQRNAMFLFAKRKQARKTREFWALQDVTFSIYEGETIGVIGRNGSGKSTISMVISGALKPDTGEIFIRGKVHLLALGIGFRPGLTGRENVMISGSILGLSRREIKEKMHEIEDFAELGDFIDEPLKTYSAGMKSRLGFAISTAVSPDILILDEVMSTGDAAFQKKANDRMAEMHERTKTVVIVSHNPGQLREMCSRVIWFEKGRILMDGKVDKVLSDYSEFCKNPVEWKKNKLLSNSDNKLLS